MPHDGPISGMESRCAKLIALKIDLPELSITFQIILILRCNLLYYMLDSLLQWNPSSHHDVHSLTWHATIVLLECNHDGFKSLWDAGLKPPCNPGGEYLNCTLTFVMLANGTCFSPQGLPTKSLGDPILIIFHRIPLQHRRPLPKRCSTKYCLISDVQWPHQLTTLTGQKHI